MSMTEHEKWQDAQYKAGMAAGLRYPVDKPLPRFDSASAEWEAGFCEGALKASNAATDKIMRK